MLELPSYMTQWDQELFLNLNKLGSSNWDAIWKFITHKLSFIPLYLFLIYGLYKKYHWKKLGITLIFIVILVALTDQIANLFKNILFMRPRPCRVSEIKETARILARCGRYGFFSGHAANSMAIAIFIGNSLKDQYKRILPLLFVWSLIVGYSRIYVGVHYPLDVLVGFTMGGIIGYSIYLFHRRFMKRYE